MKLYYLDQYLYPYWTDQFENVQKIPRDHIEDIIINKGYQWKEPSIHWTFDTSEFPDVIRVRGIQSKAPTYLKVNDGEKEWYFYPYSYNRSVKGTTSNGKIIFYHTFFRDDFMTKWYDKWQILEEVNPSVFHKHWYRPWWTKDGNNYTIDFIDQKDLSQYFNDINYQLIRKKVNGLTEDQFFHNNFTDDEYFKKDIKIYPWKNGPKDFTNGWPLNQGQTKGYFAHSNAQRRYTYIIAKSTSLVTTSNSKIIPSKATQDIVVIPLSQGLGQDVSRGLNELDPTRTQSYAVNPSGENCIQVCDSDLPFSYLYALSQKDKPKVRLVYAENIIFDGTGQKIPLFLVPLKFYHEATLVQSNQYQEGLFGKISTAIRNVNYKRIPQTEIGLLAPQYYQEVYYTGNNLVKWDFSHFIYQWNADKIMPLELKCNFNFDSNLDILYSFGTNTNTKLITFDNTNTILGNISLPINYFSSNVANYLTNNLNSAMTSLQNRQDEEKNAFFNLAMNSTKKAIEGVNFSFMDLLAPWRGAARMAGAALSIAQDNVNFKHQQTIANRNLYAQINNLASSPSINQGSPFAKSSVPTNELFTIYAYQLHEWDQDKIFAKLLNEGRVANCWDSFDAYQACYEMNILDIDPYQNYSVLLNIIMEKDLGLFNTKQDNEEFFLWLNQPKMIYEYNELINVLDWKAEDYIDNLYIEKVYAGSAGKVDINSLNWQSVNNPLPAEKSLLKAALQELNPNLTDEEIWNNLVISINIKTNNINLSIQTEHYYGHTIINTTDNTKPIVYNATLTVGDDVYYIYDVNKIMNNKNWIYDKIVNLFNEEIIIRLERNQQVKTNINIPLLKFNEKTDFDYIKELYFGVCLVNLPNFNNNTTIKKIIRCFGYNNKELKYELDRNIWKLPVNLESIEGFFMQENKWHSVSQIIFNHSLVIDQSLKWFGWVNKALSPAAVITFKENLTITKNGEWNNDSFCAIIDGVVPYFWINCNPTTQTAITQHYYQFSTDGYQRAFEFHPLPTQKSDL